MVISKQEQIALRREKVLELSSQSLTQQEIASQLMISQQTVSSDLKWLKQDASEFVRNNRTNVAFEYKQAMSNFYQLRKEAWKHFHNTQNEVVKTHLYDTIQSVNNNIMNLTAAGDMIALELETAKEQSSAIKEDIDQLVDQQQQEPEAIV